MLNFLCKNSSPARPPRWAERVPRLSAHGVLALLIFLFAWNCAHQGFPPGGPADTTPPRVLGLVPAPDSTRVGRTTALSFVFSERIDHKSFAQAIFITPNPVPFEEENELRFKWRGNTVEVRFPDSLRANRTYVVTVGTEVRDLHNNRMAASFSAAFATGDSLDRGEIHGRVFAEKPAGALILAYILEEHQEPNPARQHADYYTQLGESGTFALTNLAPGKYRVFAVTDGDGDRLYTRGEEMIGVPPYDLVISAQAPLARAMALRLAVEDTLLPALSSATSPARQYVIWSFDENVAPPDSAWAGHMHLLSAGGASARILQAVPHPLEPGHVHTIVSELQETRYRAWVEAVRDEAGILLDSLRSTVELQGTARPDTVRPRLVKISIADSARNVLLTAPVDLYFSEIMKTDSSQTALLVQDSSGARVHGDLRWQNPLHARFQPQPRWQERARYTVKIQTENFHDWEGNALFDTSGVITFWTINADTFATLSGKISDSDSTAPGRVQILARQIGGKVEYRVALERPGPYLFRDVLPGSYQISACRDANGNGKCDYGTAWPFTPAERYLAWPDTLKVRSRWPNEDNNFVLP